MGFRPSVCDRVIGFARREQGLLVAPGNPHGIGTIAQIASSGLRMAQRQEGAGAQLLLTRAYAIGRPLANASLAYLGIVFSVGYGVWLFDDPLPWSSVAGMMLIVAAGLAATMLRVQKAAAGPLNQ